MIRALALGLGVGAGIQAWRNFPPDAPVNADTLAWLFALGLVLAYLGGRWHGRHHASAWAEAHAEANAAATSQASSAVNLAVVVQGQGVEARQGSVRVPSESAPWLGQPVAAITSDDLEGIDLSELGLEDREPNR